MSKPKTSVNHDFFQHYTPEMAYIVGLISSDGHVLKDNKPVWSITLHQDDQAVLWNVLKMIASNGRPYGPYGTSNSKALYVYSQEMASDLRAMGMDNKKSQTLKWVDWSPELLPHFVRGFFDGDGSVFYTTPNNPNSVQLGINFTATKVFCEGLQAAIAGAIQGTVGHISEQTGCSVLAYQGTLQALAILNWIYADSTEITRMERKYDVYNGYTAWLEINKIEGRYVQQADRANYEIAEQIRKTAHGGDTRAQDLSKAYNIGLSSVYDILASKTHLRSDNRDSHSTRYFTAFGETKHLLDWLNDPRCVVEESTLYDRIYKREVDPELALTTLPDKGIRHWSTNESDWNNIMLTAWNETKTLHAWTQDSRCVIKNQSSLKYRICNRGLAPEAAFKTPIGELLPPDPPSAISGRTGNNAKTDWGTVAQIRQMKIDTELSNIEISDETGLTINQVNAIISNKSWNDPSYIPPRLASGSHQGLKQFYTWSGEDNLSLQDISSRTGVPVGTINRRLAEGKDIIDAARKDLPHKEYERKAPGRDGLTSEKVKSIRLDYQGGERGKALMNKYELSKSAYNDVILNRTWKEDVIWWKD